MYGSKPTFQKKKFLQSLFCYDKINTNIHTNFKDLISFNRFGSCLVQILNFVLCENNFATEKNLLQLKFEKQFEA